MGHKLPKSGCSSLLFQVQYWFIKSTNAVGNTHTHTHDRFRDRQEQTQDWWVKCFPPGNLPRHGQTFMSIVCSPAEWNDGSDSLELHGASLAVPFDFNACNGLHCVGMGAFHFCTMHLHSVPTMTFSRRLGCIALIVKKWVIEKRVNGNTIQCSNKCVWIQHRLTLDVHSSVGIRQNGVL